MVLFFVRRKENNFCPVDNIHLSRSDLFTDNSKKREIQQLKKTCPNADNGCKVIDSPHELDQHTVDCTFRQRADVFDCLFKSCGCTYQTNVQNEMDDHLKKNMLTHLNVSILEKKMFTSHTSTIITYFSF